MPETPAKTDGYGGPRVTRTQSPETGGNALLSTGVRAVTEADILQTDDSRVVLWHTLVDNSWYYY